MHRRLALLLTLATLGAAPFAAAFAQSSNGDGAAPLTTQAGVYSAAQAQAGRNVYSMQCTACHSTSTHTGAGFMRSWQGRSVWDLFSFLKSTMPQSEPGALSDQEYLQVTTYLLSINRMPPGQTDLPIDEARMKAIRIDTTAASPPPGARDGADRRR